MTQFYLPLSISLTPGDIRYHYKESKPLPAHDKVIRPLLDDSIDAFVYGLTDKSELLHSNRDILLKDRRKFRFDKTKECIRGHEYLWNATAWKRGSIVIILKKNFDFTDVFRNGYDPGITETPNSGNSPSAIKKCKEAADAGNIGICFPASNGIEWIQIYTDVKHRDKLLALAWKNCSEVDEE
ncbi:MAG: hypothetical protein QM762_04360 [Chryseolinea sp.]